MPRINIMLYRKFAAGLVAASLVVILVAAERAVACPGCSAIETSFGQDIKASDVALIAELVESPPAAERDGFAPGLGETLPKSKFRVVEVLKGADLVKGTKLIETFYLGEAKVGSPFLVKGMIDTEKTKTVVWNMPVELTKGSRNYIVDAMKLPDSGADRLAYFMKFLEDEDEVLRRDAYDEFAVSSYDDLKALAPRLPLAELRARVKNPDITGHRRRLYFTMIGAAGSKQDLPFLEGFITSSDRRQKEGLDAIIGSYLAISGRDGMPLVAELFFKNSNEFSQTQSALSAVRIAQESGTISREDSAAAFRNLLENPKLADLVIPDLARWEDWSAIDRLTDLFVNADPEDNWVRTPVLRYLQVCPLPEAKRQLARLEKIDPDAAKRAAAFAPFSALMSGAKAPASKPAEGGKNASGDGKSTAGKSADPKAGDGL
ncbi:MAG: hypothetical protein IT427_09450 [Pirellulales bacterium]|nr:hypothetical protein [Pirellulales bacterium]